jgi:hypothetical protein
MVQQVMVQQVIVQEVTMNTYLRSMFGVMALTALLSGCSDELGTAGVEDSTTAPVIEPADPAQTTTVDTTQAQTEPIESSPPETSPPETSTSQTIPVVTSDIVGAAAAGNSGGIGEGSTDSFSETIRNEDGTCSGWAARDVPAPWTDGLVSGAPFVILARESDDVLGQGNLGTSSFENVGQGDDQWICVFPFSATIVGQPDEFRIKVAELEPWVVRTDAARPGQFVASVNTVASADYFAECTDTEVFEVSEWNAVGSYWSDGIRNLCLNGLKIADIERPCRGRNEGSDYVTKVTSAVDPGVVYEDAEGLQIDVATLAAGEQVIVYIATGRPCA